MSKEDLLNRAEHNHKYHQPPNAKRIEEHQRVRTLTADVAYGLITICPEGRELALALTKLEEVMFWANAALARQVDNDWDGWLAEIQRLRDTYLNTDPEMIPMLVRNWSITEDAELDSLAWALTGPNNAYVSKGDAEGLLEFLEKYVRKQQEEQHEN